MPLHATYGLPIRWYNRTGGQVNVFPTSLPGSSSKADSHCVPHQLRHFKNIHARSHTEEILIRFEDYCRSSLSLPDFFRFNPSTLVSVQRDSDFSQNRSEAMLKLSQKSNFSRLKPQATQYHYRIIWRLRSPSKSELVTRIIQSSCLNS